MQINICDRTPFQGIRLKHQSFENFQEYALKNNFLDNFRSFINKDNFINEGAFNRVYSIPDNPTFLLRVKKASGSRKETGLVRLPDDFPDLNMGQEIARLSDDVTVVIAQKGEPCGIRHFAGIKVLPLRPEDKSRFVKYISTIADFPLKAYENLISEASSITNGKRFDVHNPQNILYDTENQCFNIVDISSNGKLKKVLSPLALASQLCDYLNLFKVLEMASPKEKELVLASAEKIVQKVKEASQNQGLKPSIKPYLHKMYALLRGKNDGVLRFLKFRAFYIKN